MTDWMLLPPGLILLFGAFLLPLLQGSARNVCTLGLPLLTLIAVWLVPEGSGIVFQLMDYELEPLRVNPAARLFATVFALAAFVGGLFALKRMEPTQEGGYLHRNGSVLELSAAFVYGGSAISVAFAGDLLTLFIFWEIMALGSTLLIWSNTSNPKAFAASMRYLLVHLLGGVVLMCGIAWYVYDTGSITFTAMQPDSWATAIIMIGFLINAGAPPLSAWIADAYPEASPSGMVFLSAFTTKTAVFVLMVGFAGAEILIYIGLYMAFYGVIYALLENDMRRVLAYSIVNQVGFMLVAIGVGTELALNGVAAHAFAHIIYKALLLMSAGSVLMMTGKRKCSELGGLFQTMPITTFYALIGALTTMAFPLTSGFVTKSLQTSAVAYEGLFWVWLLLMAASVGSILHAGVKFPWFVFFQKDSGLRPPEPNPTMRVAMAICAFLCIALGVFPGLLYALLPYPVDYHPYTATHLVYQTQLLFFGALAFFLLLPMLKMSLTINLDFDWFYRRLFWVWGSRAIDLISRGRDSAEQVVTVKLKGFIDYLRTHHDPSGMFARHWPSGNMVLWVAILLASSLVMYYVQF